MISETKILAIKDTLKKTKERRKNQVCVEYELKVDLSHLSKTTLNVLFMLFIEAKWLYNYVLSMGVFDIDYKISTVQIKIKDQLEERMLRYLTSQMKQEIIDRMKDNIKGLSKLKNNGHKIGGLKYKRNVESIPLKQYGITFSIFKNGYIRIQGIKQRIKVMGLEQIPKDAEIANAVLLKKHDDIYVHVATYRTKQESQKKMTGEQSSVGIDFGIKEQLTYSNGAKVEYRIPKPKKLKRIQRKLSGQHRKKGKQSKNYRKTKKKLNKLQDKTVNIKKDIGNKVVAETTQKYEIVITQNDNIKGWQRVWGKRIEETVIGRIRYALGRKALTFVAVDRFLPTTKECSHCHHIQEINLSERIYKCGNCGLIIDRNLNSAIVEKYYGMKELGIVPTVRREFTPLEIEPSTLAFVEYMNSIPYVRASLVDELGSLTALA